jgi:hypothetical protein
VNIRLSVGCLFVRRAKDLEQLKDSAHKQAVSDNRLLAQRASILKVSGQVLHTAQEKMAEVAANFEEEIVVRFHSHFHKCIPICKGPQLHSGKKSGLASNPCQHTAV